MVHILKAKEKALGQFVEIDERKIGKGGHQLLGEMRANQWWISMLTEGFVKTRDRTEKAIFDTLLTVGKEYDEQVKMHLAHLSKSRGALRFMEDTLDPADLPN